MVNSIQLLDSARESISIAALQNQQLTEAAVGLLAGRSVSSLSESEGILLNVLKTQGYVHVFEGYVKDSWER